VVTTTPAIVRIAKYLVRSGEDECWGWTGHTDHLGYAKIDPGPGEHGRSAAKFVLEDALGRALRPGLETCHSCDEPGCCNPRHLREDTHASNMADMARRGRAATGLRNAHGKLTDEEVAALRADPRHPNEVATAFGVSAPYVYNVRAGRRRAVPRA
jgi:hypothetical protein